MIYINSLVMNDSKIINVVNECILQSLLICNESLILRLSDFISTIKGHSTDNDNEIFEYSLLILGSIRKDLEDCNRRYVNYYTSLNIKLGAKAASTAMITGIKIFVPKMLDKYPNICTKDLLTAINSFDMVNLLYPFIKDMLEKKLSETK